MPEYIVDVIEGVTAQTSKVATTILIQAKCTHIPVASPTSRWIHPLAASCPTCVALHEKLSK